MASTTFDAIEYMKKLEGAGCSKQLAEVQAQEMAHILDEHMFTKQDGNNLEKNINSKLDVIKNEITVKIGKMIFVAVTILGIIHFFR